MCQESYLLGKHPKSQGPACRFIAQLGHSLNPQERWEARRGSPQPFRGCRSVHLMSLPFFEALGSSAGSTPSSRVLSNRDNAEDLLGDVRGWGWK